MTTTDMYINERLDHLGIVAGVCQEIGLAAWLDAQDPGNRQQVSVGTATVAMLLNGLGWSLRQLYLVPQFFANKPIEHLLGPRGSEVFWELNPRGSRSICRRPGHPADSVSEWTLFAHGRRPQQMVRQANVRQRREPKAYAGATA